MLLAGFRVEEMRIELQHAVEIERAAIKNGVECHLRPRRLVNGAVGVELADGQLDLAQFVRTDQIGLVENDDIGEGHLILGLRRIAETLEEELGVDQRHHGIEAGILAHLVIHEERLGHRHRIGETGGLDQNGIEGATPLDQVFDDTDQIAAHRAADAAVVHLEDFLVALDDEVIVDADLAELVDDDGVALAVVLGENAVEQRGLAGPEVAGQYGHRNRTGLDCIAHRELHLGTAPVS